VAEGGGKETWEHPTDRREHSKEDEILKDVSLIVYTVADVPKAKRFFGELIGADPYADSARYVGYKSGDMEIGLVPSADEHEPVAPLPYWTVSDITASVTALIAAGGTVVQEITDVGYGLQVASVKDPNGAIVGLRQFPKG
jgi:predicted enzyme related to lactoylglutathione lyase